MKVIVCLADNGGMMFNKRRQSRDAEVILDICRLSGGRVHISEYSAPLFEKCDARVILSADPLSAADEGEYVFIESGPILPHLAKLEELIIYKWNRDYPADLFIDIDPERVGMTLDSTLDIVGRSHEKVTRLIWKGDKNR